MRKILFSLLCVSMFVVVHAYAAPTAAKTFACMVSIPGSGGPSEVSYGQSKTITVTHKQTGKSYKVRMELGRFNAGDLLNVEVREQGKQIINSAVAASAPSFSFNLIPTEIGMAVDCKKK